MTYILHTKPIQRTAGVNYLALDLGIFLSSITDEAIVNINLEDIGAIEITEIEAGKSLFRSAYTKGSDTKKSIKYWPNEVGEDPKPSINHVIAGSTVSGGAVRYVVTEADENDGRDYNIMVMSFAARNVFNNRYQLINIKDSDAERDTYDQQLAEADSYNIDNTAVTPLLNAIATAKGIDLPALVSSIYTAKNSYDASLLDLLIKEKSIQKQISEATTLDESLLLREDLFGERVNRDLAIRSGRQVAGEDREDTPSSKIGIQF